MRARSQGTDELVLVSSDEKFGNFKMTSCITSSDKYHYRICHLLYFGTKLKFSQNVLIINTYSSIPFRSETIIITGTSKYTFVLVSHVICKCIMQLTQWCLCSWHQIIYTQDMSEPTYVILSPPAVMTQVKCWWPSYVEDKVALVQGYERRWIGVRALMKLTRNYGTVNLRMWQPYFHRFIKTIARPVEDFSRKKEMFLRKRHSGLKFLSSQTKVEALG